MIRAAVAAGAADKLHRLASFGGRQAAASAALFLACVLAAWRLRAFAWLALFIALLAAAGLATALLLLARSALQALSRRLGGAVPERHAGLVAGAVPGWHADGQSDAGWLWTWAALALALPAGAGAAIPAYRALAHLFVLRGLTPAQVFGAALAFTGLLLALPLVQMRRQSQALQLAALKQAALAAELKSLQAQVEPHFLYNTLANTRYLARHDPAKAVAMLDHFIAYLHTALPDMRTPASTLGRECELARHYLALMAIRFGERMTYEIVCPPELAQAELPPLMLMSLVENAVRHGVEARPGAVHVRVGAARIGVSLHVLVVDSGAGLARTVLGSGVGLRNVRERLAAQHGALAGFELRTGSGGWTEAELRLPLAWSAAGRSGPAVSVDASDTTSRAARAEAAPAERAAAGPAPASREAMAATREGTA